VKRIHCSFIPSFITTSIYIKQSITGRKRQRTNVRTPNNQATMASPAGIVLTQSPASFVLIGALPQEDGTDRTVSYTCDTDLVTIYSLIRFETPYVYDLQYPCVDSVDSAMQGLSENLLRAAAEEYEILPPGMGCAVPPLGYGNEGVRANWIAGAFSNATDFVVPNEECLSVPSENSSECCVVVAGSMQFQPSGGYDADEFRDFVQDTIDEPFLTFGESFQATWRGVEIDYVYSPAQDPRDKFESETEDPRDAGDNIVSAIGGTEPIGQQDENSKITALGGALLSGLVVTAISVLLIVFRRRRQSRFDDHDLDPNMSKTDMDTHHAESLETLQLDVLSDGGMNNNSSPRRSQERYDESPSNQSYEYKFDLGNSMKNDVMGAYGGGGPTSMAVVSPYPMSGECSDNASEVDSWAQTDGTVGSLEDNLEEITAEI
jgi:hypothetical protein